MFDTAGARNRVLTNVILAVRDLVVPVEPSSVVTNDLLQFLDMIETLSDLAVQTGGEALAVRGFYFNRVERNTRAHRDNMEDVREGLAETAYRVSAPCIPKTTLIEKAASARAPVVTEFPAEPVSQSYREVFADLFEEFT
ncbi:ParA family protein [Alkalilimnicola ehrlichii]|uniref:ParA family protein n=1 Tax=Alkalilimnicola ehrlichii TaxID=351052 RepID=UPI0011C01D41|nr:hypothetical protein [Alkalilimnicola ehrlichii]